MKESLRSENEEYKIMRLSSVKSKIKKTKKNKNKKQSKSLSILYN